MEILLGIAVKLAEYSVRPIIRQVGYLACYKSNHQNLQDRLKDINAAKDDVQHEVDQVERQGGTRTKAVVLNWRTRVDEIIRRTEEFMADDRHTQTECLYGFCPQPVMRYKLGKKSAKLAEEIVELQKQKDFPTLAYDVPLQDPCLLSTRNYHAFASRDSTVMKVMDELKNPDSEMILVWGIGGVGKTTLVEAVVRQATRDNLFDDVVMVKDVKENPDLAKIQREIAKKLGMSIDENDTLEERAPKLCDRIKNKRTLVVLDDVWKEVDLVAIGLPRLVNCKVLLTNRTRQILSKDYRKQEDIQVDVMDEDEAWSLFQKMVGDVIKDSRIQPVAKQVAEKCGRLPIMIVTLARALKDKTKVSEWKDTLRRLKSFDKNKFKEKTFLALEWSYKQLEESEVQPLFLLCGILSFQNHIRLGELFTYSFGLGLTKNVDTIEEARDAFDTLVERLKDSSLLMDSDENTHIRMHDLVCEVAVLVASRDQKVLLVEDGAELKEWPKEDYFRKCIKMSLRSNTNVHMLSQVPVEVCQNLEMMCMYNNDKKYSASTEFPSNFFREMMKLRVLGVNNVRMTSLPSSLECLKNLQTLSLEECKLGDVTLVGHLTNLEIISFAWSDIEELPKEIGQLIRLRRLNLNYCTHLEVISPNVFSRLENLEELTMREVSLKWEGELGSSNIDSLKELKDLSRLTTLEIFIKDAEFLPPNMFSTKLLRYQILIGNVWEESDWTTGGRVVNTLKLQLVNLGNEFEQGIRGFLQRCENLALEGSEAINGMLSELHDEDFQQLIHLRVQNNVDFTNIVKRKVMFPNLTTLSVYKLNHIRFLFTVSMAKSLVELKHLKVTDCEMMEEIVSTRDEANAENINIAFSKLESLLLGELPHLTSMISMDSSTECFLMEMIGTELDGESGTGDSSCLFDSKIKFPSLERLKIYSLPKFQTLWSKKKLADDQDSFHKLRQVGVYRCDSLMNMFVPSMMGRLNNLETLEIMSCKSLEVVFEDGKMEVEDHQQKPVYCQNLVTVDISRCNGLRNIFPASVARGLQKLRRLKVLWCDEVEEIIGGEQGLETEPHPMFEFPNVTSLTLHDLPKLCRFYPGMHASRWPLLKELELKRLSSEVKIIAGDEEQKNPMIQKSFFLVEKDSFPSLEGIESDIPEIWYGGPSSSPTEVFSRLNHIRLYSETFFSKQSNIDFLQNSPKLTTLDAWQDNSTEILFVGEDINSGEEIHHHHPLGLSAVKTLRIKFMYKLLQLGNGNYQTSGPLFPCLDTLEVFECDLLKSPVESSAISFRFLTTLSVFACGSLEYLISYSAAKSMTQLTTLEVKYCDMMRVVIEDDHHTQEGTTCHIAFPRLQSLSLLGLTSLVSFCSGNCSVTLPSLTKLHVIRCGIHLEISSQGVLLISHEKPKPQEDLGDGSNEEDDEDASGDDSNEEDDEDASGDGSHQGDDEE